MSPKKIDNSKRLRGGENDSDSDDSSRAADLVKKLIKAPLNLNQKKISSNKNTKASAMPATSLNSIKDRLTLN